MAVSVVAKYGHRDHYSDYVYEPKVSLEFIELFVLISRIEFF